MAIEIGQKPENALDISLLYITSSKMASPIYTQIKRGRGETHKN